jgi:hypothetical protein
MSTLKRKYYRKYDIGGTLLSSIQKPDILSTLGTSVDALDSPDQYGRQTTATQTLKGAASGAALGSKILPGWGTAAGAVIGGTMGFINGNKSRDTERNMQANQKLAEQQYQLNRSGAILSADPALVTGRKGAEFYATGGFLKGKFYDSVKAVGGKLNSLSTDSAEVQGPSHEQGGVDLPQYGSEVEGGETLQGDYVFSDRLGFAQQHKKLARAIGKTENKPATPDRINSLRKMRQAVEGLKAQQEAVREQYNLQ